MVMIPSETLQMSEQEAADRAAARSVERGRDATTIARLKQDNARLRVLLRSVKNIVPIGWRERIQEELKD